MFKEFTVTEKKCLLE